MPGFARPFNFLRRMFPTSGIQVPTPSEVTDSVQLTHELTKASFVNSETRFRRFVITTVSPGGAVSHNMTEPDPGFIQFPVLLAVSHDSAALVKLQVDTAIVLTVAPQDVWGGWETVSRTLTSCWVEPIAAGGGGAGLTPIYAPLCMTRGFQYQVNYTGTGAGVNLRTHFYYLDVPGEFVTADLILKMRVEGRHGFTRAT